MGTVVTKTHGITLPSRYEIRRVDGSIRDWVTAMGIEGFMLRDATVWKPILPEPKTANALRGFTQLAGHYEHSIMSGLSYVIIDTKYVFRRPESAAEGGRLYWDELEDARFEDGEFEARGAEMMRDAMDFPIVCVALSFDAFSPRDAQATRDLLDLLPLQTQLGAFLAPSGGQDAASAMIQPTNYGQVLNRSGCVTRTGYEGRGLATALTHFVILEAKARGFRGISVGVSSASMLRCWMSPPPGCSSKIVTQWSFEDIELKDDEGQTIKPYVGSGMKEGWQVWCDLTE